MLLSKFMTFLPVFQCVSTLGFRFSLATGAAWASFGVLAWSFVVNSMAQDEFWSLSSLLFDVRQSKRLFSLIDSGGFLAKIIGYFSVPLLLPFMGVGDLLILSAAGSLISALLVKRIVVRYRHLLDHPTGRIHPGLAGEHHAHASGAKHPDEHKAHDSEPLAHSIHHTSEHHGPRRRSVAQTLLRHRYLASLSLVAFLAFFAMTCIDYGFLREIEQKYESQASIASFLALFLGGTKVISFLLKVGVAGRLFNRFGLAKTSVVLPLGLVVVTGVGLSVTWGGAEHLFIWFFIGNMLLVEMWAEAVHVPALAIALQPLHLHERHEGRYAVSDVMEPLALGGAALLLYLLSSVRGLDLQDVCIVLLGVLAAWVLAIGWMDIEYKNTIRRALRHRRVEGAELVWDDITRKVIEQKLESTHQSEVEYALNLIPKTESAFFISWLPKLLHHYSSSLGSLTDIPQRALQRAEDFEFTPEERSQLVPVVEGILVESNTEPALLGQALHTYASLQHDLDPESLRHWLDDERAEVREGIITGLIRFQGIDGILLAGERLQAMLHSPIVAERKAAADIVGKVGVKQFYHPLLVLLADDEAEVRMAATRAAAHVGHPRLIRPLIELYLTPTLSHSFLMQIENALRGFGNAVFPYLGERVDEGVFDSARLQRMMRLLGFWGTARSVQLLTAFLTWPVTHRRVLGELRLAALRAIVQAGVELPDKALPNQLLEEELSRATSLMALILQLDALAVRFVEDPTDDRGPEHDSISLLRGAVACEVVNVAHRVLLLLAVLHDSQTIIRVRDSIFAGNDLHRANAFETLDSILSPARSRSVITLLEATLLLSGKRADVSNLKELLQSNAVDARSSLREVLELLVRDDERFYDVWTVATAIYYAGLHSWGECASIIVHATQRTDFVGEVARMVVEYRNVEGRPATGLVRPSFSTQDEGTANTGIPFFIYHSAGKPMPIIFERVILLKTVDLFRETPDPVLAHIAQAMEEVHVHKGEVVMRKGELGTCLYIIEEGSVRVHDGDHTLAHLKSRQVVGELALLDPEPRSASVTAEEDTILLKLDWEVFYDLMVDNIEIARGAITTLCRRIRTQNEKLAKLAAPLPERSELEA